MKTNFANRNSESGFSRKDLAWLIFISIPLGLVVFILISSLSAAKAIALRMNCSSNLSCIGFAFKVWENDNNDKFPMQALTNEIGAPLFATACDSSRYFLAMSNELAHPKILLCPSDDHKIFATNWGLSFSNSNISYFIGLDAKDELPHSFLSGDNNISSDHPDVDGKLILTTKQPAEFAKERHNSHGNVLLVDGSVPQWSSSGLQQGIGKTGLATNILLMNR